MIDLTGVELALAEKVLAEPELGNDGEPVHEHDDDFRYECHKEELEAKEAERQMIEHTQER